MKKDDFFFQYKYDYELSARLILLAILFGSRQKNSAASAGRDHGILQRSHNALNVTGSPPAEEKGLLLHDDRNFSFYKLNDSVLFVRLNAINTFSGVLQSSSLIAAPHFLSFVVDKSYFV